jgi:hypothetical protein
MPGSTKQLPPAALCHLQRDLLMLLKHMLQHCPDVGNDGILCLWALPPALQDASLLLIQLQKAHQQATGDCY